MKLYTRDSAVETLQQAKQKWKEIPWGRTRHYKGENINNLILQYRTENSKHSQPRFVFQCYCGKYNMANGTSISDGRTSSCGCKQTQNAIKIHKEKIIDLTNQRFGNLIALEYIDNEEINKKTNGKAWKCKCDCGNITYVGQNTLRKGLTKSCGQIDCPYANNKINLLNFENEYFKVLTVDKEKTKEHQQIYWKCQCKNCGSVTSLITSAITSGRTKSCGCIRSSAGEAKIQKILQNNKIIYQKEKTFKDCSFNNNSKSHCRFDFYIPKQGYLIEYDGDIHFKTLNSGWNTEQALQKRKELDKYKNNYCKEHNIPLIRIPYTHYSQLCLQDLLLKTSKFIYE